MSSRITDRLWEVAEAFLPAGLTAGFIGVVVLAFIALLIVLTIVSFCILFAVTTVIVFALSKVGIVQFSWWLVLALTLVWMVIGGIKINLGGGKK
jgi:hypothetical protein